MGKVSSVRAAAGLVENATHDSDRKWAMPSATWSNGRLAVAARRQRPCSNGIPRDAANKSMLLKQPLKTKRLDALDS